MAKTENVSVKPLRELASRQVGGIAGSVTQKSRDR
jgi:hypothetical protein